MSDVSQEDNATINGNNIGETIKDLESTFGEFPDDLLIQINKFCFENGLYATTDGELKIKFVVDANIILQSAITLAKKGRHNLLLIADSPFVEFITPSFVDQELERHIPEIADEKGIPKEKLRQEVIKIREKMHTVPDSEFLVPKTFLSFLELKDPNDLPYMALYYHSRSNGVVTRNQKDYVSSVKTFNLGEVGKIATIYKWGSTMIYIETKSIQYMTYLIINLMKLIIKSTIELYQIMLFLLSNIVFNGLDSIIRSFQKLHPVIKAIITGLVFYIIYNYQDIISINMSRIISNIVKILDGLHNTIVEIAEIFECMIPELKDTEFIRDFWTYHDIIKEMCKSARTLDEQKPNEIIF